MFHFRHDSRALESLRFLQLPTERRYKDPRRNIRNCAVLRDSRDIRTRRFDHMLSAVRGLNRRNTAELFGKRGNPRGSQRQRRWKRSCRLGVGAVSRTAPKGPLVIFSGLEFRGVRPREPRAGVPSSSSCEFPESFHRGSWHARATPHGVAAPVRCSSMAWSPPHRLRDDGGSAPATPWQPLMLPARLPNRLNKSEPYSRLRSSAHPE